MGTGGGGDEPYALRSSPIGWHNSLVRSRSTLHQGPLGRNKIMFMSSPLLETCIENPSVEPRSAGLPVGRTHFAGDGRREPDRWGPGDTLGDHFFLFCQN
jgi:hypothetical protein